MSLNRLGYQRFAWSKDVRAWAAQAYEIAAELALDLTQQATNLRHGSTWFVGVDALPNEPNGAINDVPLSGAWQAFVPNLKQHKAQVSIIYPGYPQQDPDESDGNHRFRTVRAAAHVDGILPIGPERRRYALEYHAYILGIPLNTSTAAPTVVWPGSHKIMTDMFQKALVNKDPKSVELTQAYGAARKLCFDQIEPVPVQARPGECFLIHRHALHGTQPWNDAPHQEEGRMIAFLRPEFGTAKDWLDAP